MWGGEAGGGCILVQPAGPGRQRCMLALAVDDQRRCADRICNHTFTLRRCSPVTKAAPTRSGNAQMHTSAAARRPPLIMNATVVMSLSERGSTTANPGASGLSTTRDSAPAPGTVSCGMREPHNEGLDAGGAQYSHTDQEPKNPMPTRARRDSQAHPAGSGAGQCRGLPCGGWSPPCGSAASSRVTVAFPAIS